MVVLTIIFAVLNICLGFALAVYLGRGLSVLSKTGKALGTRRMWAIAESGTEIPVVSSRLNADFIEQASPDSRLEEADIGKEDDLAGCAANECDGESYDDNLAEPLESSLPENWDLNEKYVETSILRLNVAMIKSDKRAIQIDSKLRASLGNTERDVIRACVQLLREDCLTYLAEQKEAAEKFQSRINEFGQLSSLCEEIEMTNLEQTAQVETTLKNLEYMDFHTDLEAANQRLLEEIKNLCLARHKLRDNQEAAFLTVARHENRLDKIDKKLFLDALTGLRNRIGLETTLFNWWRHGQHQRRHMLAMLFDIDRFGAVNQKYGPLLGDLVLCQVAQYLQNSIGKADMLGRYAGQQFLTMVLDIDSSAVLKNAELWRQSIEKIVFLHEVLSICITVSGAVTVIGPSDTYPAILERLENMIRQVKEMGGNRIFFHNGTKSAPVEPHDIKLPQVEIVV